MYQNRPGNIPNGGSIPINIDTGSKSISSEIDKKPITSIDVASYGKPCKSYIGVSKKQSSITDYFHTTGSGSRACSKNSNIHSLLARLKKSKEVESIFDNSLINNSNNLDNEKKSIDTYSYLNRNKNKVHNCNTVQHNKNTCAIHTSTTEVVRKKSYQEHHNKRFKPSVTAENQSNILDYYEIRKLYSARTEECASNSLSAVSKILNTFKKIKILNKDTAQENTSNHSIIKNTNTGGHISTSLNVENESIPLVINTETGRERNHPTDKITLDDFCKNITQVIKNSKNNKKTITFRESMKISKIEGNVKSHKNNPFYLKSYSTDHTSNHTNGNKQYKCYKDLNSLPITDKELTSRRITSGKLAFDDFGSYFLSDINKNSITTPSAEEVCNDSLNVSEQHLCNKPAINNIRRVKQISINDILSTTKQYEEKPEDNIEASVLTHVNSNISNMSNLTDRLELQSNAYNETEMVKKIVSQEEEYLQVLQNYETQGQSENYLQYYPTGVDFLQIIEDIGSETNQNNTQCEGPVTATFDGVLMSSNSELIKNASTNGEGITSNEYVTKYINSSCRENISSADVKADVVFRDGDGADNMKFLCPIEIKSSDKPDGFSDIANPRLENDHISNAKGQQIEKKETDKLSEFLENLLKQNTDKTQKNPDSNNTPQRRTISSIKRYRKGKTKIYRLKKLKRAGTKTIDRPETESLDFYYVCKKMTQKPAEVLRKCKSMSSISTASSYITDDETKSEIFSSGSSSGSNELTSPQVRLRKGFNELSKDKSLLYYGDCDNISDNINKAHIRMKIQELFLKTFEDIQERSDSSLLLRRQSFSNCIFKDGRLQMKPMAESLKTVINSKSRRSRAKFKLIMYLMKKIQTLLETDTKVTKRELYYQLKTLVSAQRVTDRALNTISCLLDVGPWALNIVAQKGLVFGNLKLQMSSGEILNCNIPGTLIPQDVNDIVEIQSPAYFILVIEKEAIFHKLIEEDLPNRLTRPFIMITGKGFPDLNTQLFLKKLWMIMSIPVFILVDADPHGINIMLNYRFGSVNNAHVSHQLAVPNAKWLGVYPSEVVNYNLTREPLSEREVKLVHHLLKTPYMECNPRIVDELKVLLDKKYKAEIEGLIKSETYLSEVYLPRKFFSHNFI